MASFVLGNQSSFDRWKHFSGRKEFFKDKGGQTIISIISTNLGPFGAKVSSFYFGSVWEFHNCNRVPF